MIPMSSVGEKAFLKNLLPRLFVAPSFINGFGHDASVIDIGLPEELLVMKIDRAASPEGHIKRGWADYKMWGRLAVTANCSDVLASGGVPKGMMLAICVPPTWNAQDVTDIILGCEAECRRWGVAFLGGDTKEAREPQIVGSAIGTVGRAGYLSRGGEPGQIIVIAGSLGGYVGVYLELTSFARGALPEAQYEQWKEYITHPTARWAEAAIMRKYGVATAGMDTSDGLYDALSAMSGDHAGVEIELDALPYHEAAIVCAQTLNVPLFNTALSPGDWNIVYSVDAEHREALEAEARANHIALTVIGRFTETPGITARDDKGNRFQVVPVVNEHFRSRMEDERSFVEQIRSQVSLLSF